MNNLVKLMLAEALRDVQLTELMVHSAAIHETCLCYVGDHLRQRGGHPNDPEFRATLAEIKAASASDLSFALGGMGFDEAGCDHRGQTTFRITNHARWTAYCQRLKPADRGPKPPQEDALD